LVNKDAQVAAALHVNAHQHTTESLDILLGDLKRGLFKNNLTFSQMDMRYFPQGALETEQALEELLKKEGINLPIDERLLKPSIRIDKQTGDIDFFID